MGIAALLHYLRVPLHFSPLVLIFVFSLMLTVSEHAGLWGLPTLLIIGSWFFKYGFAVLDHTIHGRAEAPVLSAEMINPVEQRPMGTFLLIMAIYFLTDKLSSWISPTQIFLVRIVLLAMIPAVIAGMSITGKFFAALNPLAVVGTISRIPMAYALLLVVIGAIWFLPWMVLRSASETLAALWRLEVFLPGQTLVAIGFKGVVVEYFAHVVFMYCWLAMFACIGGTLYEHRNEVEYEAAESPERKEARANAMLERERDKIIDRIFAELRGGALGNAGETMRKLINESPRPIDECRWLYARAINIDQRLANFLAQVTLPKLLEVKATGEAITIVRERLNAVPEFRPKTSGELLRLAQLARDAGDRATARKLLVEFDKFFPNDPMAAVALQLQQELQR